MCPVQVQENGNGSIRENGLVMASVTQMAAAAKQAEERIRLDIGDDISVEDEVTTPRKTPIMSSISSWHAYVAECTTAKLIRIPSTGFSFSFVDAMLIQS